MQTTDRNRFARTAAVLMAAVWVAGCATQSGRPAQADVAVPTGWVSGPAVAAPSDRTVGAETLATWWERFGDTTLTRYVQQALQHNAEIAAAQASLRQARAVRLGQEAQLFPTVDASASGSRSKQRYVPSSTLYQAGLDASWEPDIFGGQRSAIDAASADEAASAASLGDVQVSIAAETALAFIDLRSGQQRLVIARANLAAQEETLQIAQWRRQAGLIGELDVEQARASVEQTRATVPALESTVSANSTALAVLLGATPQAVMQSIQARGAMPAAPGDLALSIPADTLRQRADVRNAELGIVAAQARTREAEAARYPSLRIGGSVGLSSLTLGALTNSSSLGTSLLASITMPIFDAGAISANIDAQAAALARAGATYRQTVLVALKDVEDTLVALRKTRERLVILQRATASAAAADEMARQRYSSGLIGFVTVLDAQRTLLSLQDSVAGAQADVLSEHVRLYKALGGGWQPETAALPDDARMSAAQPASTQPTATTVPTT